MHSFGSSLGELERYKGMELSWKQEQGILQEELAALRAALAQTRRCPFTIIALSIVDRYIVLVSRIRPLHVVGAALAMFVCGPT